MKKVFLILIGIILSGCGGSGSSSSGSTENIQKIEIVGDVVFIQQIQSALDKYLPSCLIRIQSGPANGYEAIYRGSGVVEISRVATPKYLVGTLAHENEHCKNPALFNDCETSVEHERQANLEAARVSDSLGYHQQAKWWRNQSGRHQGCAI